MREIRPYFLHGRQNNTVDGRLVLEIRKQLSLLQQRMRATGQMFGALKRHLADGAVIVTSVSYNGPVPLLRAYVIAGGSDAGKIDYIFESGVMGELWDGDSTAPNILTIFLSNQQGAYFSSPGVTFVESNTQRLLHGTYAKGANYDFTEIESNFDLDRSLIDGVSSYLSYGHTTPLRMGENVDPILLDGAPGTYTISSMYTGLLRLAVQARYARGTDFLADNPIETLFPWGIEIDPLNPAYKHDGLVRAPDYTYFFIRTESSGCKACRMQTAPELENLRDLLARGEIAEDEADYVEGFLLSSLLPARLEGGELDEIVLLTQNEVTPAQDPAIGSPLAYGWHYSYPPLSECAIIRHGVQYYEAGSCPNSPPAYGGVLYYAYETKIHFTFEINEQTEKYDISASAFTEDKGYWKNYPDAQTIWIPDQYHGTRLMSFWARGCDVEQCNAPLYCFYSKAGYKTVWLNNKELDLDEIHIPPLADRRTCAYTYAVPTISLTNLGATNLYSFSIDSAEDLEETSLPKYIGDGSGGSWEYTLSPTEDAYNEYVSTMVGVPGTPDTDLERTFLNYVGICPSISVNRDRGYGALFTPGGENYEIRWAQQIEGVNYIPYISTSLIIPRLNAEAAVLLSRRARTRTQRKDYRDNRSDTSTMYYAGKFRVGDNPGIVFNGGFQVGLTGLIGSGFGFILSSPQFVTGTLSNFYLLNSWSTNNDEISQREYSMQIVHSNGYLQPEITEEKQFDYYFNKDWNKEGNNGWDAIGFSLQESYQGRLKYPTYGVSGTSPLGHPELTGYSNNKSVILDYKRIRWIGVV